MMWLAMKALKAPRCIVFATHRQAEKLRAFCLLDEMENVLVMQDQFQTPLQLITHKSTTETRNVLFDNRVRTDIH